MKRNTLYFFLFISPWLLGFLFFVLLPMLISLYMSFTRTSILTTPVWVGWLNYKACLQGWEPNFYNTIRVTLGYSLLSVPLTLLTALLAAMLLNVPRIRGMSAFRTIFFIPSLLPVAASGILWGFIFQSKYGLLNRIITFFFGGTGPQWLIDPTLALLCLVLIAVWGFGGYMIIFLAGLQGVSQSLVEAAMLDGASSWQRFRHVVVPQISPVIFFNLIMGIIGAMQVFSIAYIFQQSSAVNRDATNFFVLNIFNNGFTNDRYGLACAQAWMLLIAILLMSGIVFWTSKRWVYYEH